MNPWERFGVSTRNGLDSLSAIDEEYLTLLMAKLEIQPELVRNELEAIQDLSRIRAIKDGNLPTQNSTHKLKPHEVCHFQDKGRLLKRRIVQRFQRNGVKYKVHALTLDKEGLLSITSDRVLLIHEGTTSIPHKRIVSIEIDIEFPTFYITKEGAKNPIYISTPKAIEACCLISQLARVPDPTQ